jgi:hypothetical protein
LVLPFIGTYTWLKGRICAAQYLADFEIQKAMPHEDQLLWKFSIEDTRINLNWEHSREFEYKGEMYDVIRSETKGDSIWYWCYWDRKETKLRKELNVLLVSLMGPGQQSKNEGRQLNDFFKSLFLPVSSVRQSLVAGLDPQRDKIPYNFSLHAFERIPPVPPPRII